jgi:hypothetical protein
MCISSLTSPPWGLKFCSRFLLEDLAYHLTHLFVGGPPLFLWRDWLPSQLLSPLALIRSALNDYLASAESQGYFIPLFVTMSHLAFSMLFVACSGLKTL